VYSEIIGQRTKRRLKGKERKLLKINFEFDIEEAVFCNRFFFNIKEKILKNKYYITFI